MLAMDGFFYGGNSGRAFLQLTTLLLVKLCMVFARSAAMAFNRWLDAEFDKKNLGVPRNGKYPPALFPRQTPLWFVTGNVLLFMATTWFINSALLLSPLPCWWCWGTVIPNVSPPSATWCSAWAQSCPIGGLAVTGYFSLLPVLLSVMVLVIFRYNLCLAGRGA